MRFFEEVILRFPGLRPAGLKLPVIWAVGTLRDGSPNEEIGHAKKGDFVGSWQSGALQILKRCLRFGGVVVGSKNLHMRTYAPLSQMPILFLA